MLNAVFKALADPSRRKLLDELRTSNGQTLTELCEHLEMTRQAVTKHLLLLEEANLVATVWRGREKLHFLNPVPLHEIYERWICKYERSRLQVLSDLKKGLEKTKTTKPKTNKHYGKEHIRLRHLHPHRAGKTLGKTDRDRGRA